MNRRRLSYLLAALGAIAFIWAFLLAHGSGHQTVQGWKPNPREPDGRGEETSVRVECASPASGPRPHGVGEPDADAVAEDNGWELSQRLVDYTDAYEVCDRVRTERLTHAGELAVVGLLLSGATVLVGRGGRRDR